eukprot:7728398-Alexandrium_andersonii.AAC.1
MIPLIRWDGFGDPPPDPFGLGLPFDDVDSELDRLLQSPSSESEPERDLDLSQQSTDSDPEHALDPSIDSDSERDLDPVRVA